MKLFKLILVILFLFPGVLFADTQDAIVTTQSGSYSVPVEVDGGEVTYVHWPNGGDMHVYGGEIEDGIATGTNSRGDVIQIEIEE